MNEYLQKQRHAVDLTDGQIASFNSAYLKETRQADIQWFMNFIPTYQHNSSLLHYNVSKYENVALTSYFIGKIVEIWHSVKFMCKTYKVYWYIS